MPLRFVCLLERTLSRSRLDESSEATLISVGNDDIKVSTRLVPGVAVSAAIIAEIDTDGDGTISDAEQRHYAERVLRDLSITVDGAKISPTLDSQKFLQSRRSGKDSVKFRSEFSLALPLADPTGGSFSSNHHHNEISAYLVILSGSRSTETLKDCYADSKRKPIVSINWITYREAGTGDTGVSNWPSSISGWMGRVRTVASDSRSRHAAYCRRVRPFCSRSRCFCPLRYWVVGSRWSGFAGVRQSRRGILEVVTALRSEIP